MLEIEMSLARFKSSEDLSVFDPNVRLGRLRSSIDRSRIFKSAFAMADSEQDASHADDVMLGGDVTASWNGFRLDRSSGRVVTPLGFSVEDRLNQTFGGFDHEEAFLTVNCVN